MVEKWKEKCKKVKENGPLETKLARAAQRDLGLKMVVEGVRKGGARGRPREEGETQ